MDALSEIKAKIDLMSYVELLRLWRFAPLGDPLFLGESGTYFKNRLLRLKAEDPDGAVAASKQIGW